MWLPGATLRDRLAVLMALVTVVGLIAAFLLSKGTQVLMPGPLASAHGAMENCNTCHTKSGSGKLSWVHGLVAGDPLADSKACLTCHKMPDTAFNAHGASAEVLKQSTERLEKTAAQTPVPQSARAQSVAFPTQDIVARGLYCATCHQEHQGANFDLSRISNEQCRSCHVVKFDSFDGDHPKFENYPFKRRSRIAYDHAGHFGKHFPDVAKKHPARRIPATCSTCHNSSADRRVMAVAPFEKTCTACHLDQIAGKERVSGPKGIAFLTLPGLDLQTLAKRKAAIGEWPDESEAELAPFMKVMIGKDDRGRALVKAVEGLNLQDLSGASDGQIEAVADLVWEIKGLFHALIKGKASDVLGDLNIAGGAKLSASLVADLTASLPRDVVASAQQQWLPNLAAEMAGRPARRGDDTSGWNAVTTESSLEEPPARTGSTPDTGAKADGRKNAANKLPPPMRAGVIDADVGARPGAETRKADGVNASEVDDKVRIAADDVGGAITGRWSLPSGTPRALESRNKDGEQADAPDDAAEKPDAADDDAEVGAPTPAAAEPPPGSKAASDDAETAAPSTDAAGRGDTADAAADHGNEQPGGEATKQADDLLFPTEEELRTTKAGTGGGGAPSAKGATGKPDPDTTAADATQSEDAASEAETDTSATTDAGAAAAPAPAAPVISIESDVDPESWAEYGGWYRQDFAIYYRPTGHKDKFIYSWLYLTGPQARTGDASPAAAVFDTLTGKEAQGSCTKCHSVDDIPGKGRLVNFSPPSVADKRGRFTNFIHEPHFGILENRGCLTCHNLEKGRPYLKSYEQGDPHSFVSNFGAVKKDLCQSCHTATMARQDCLTCHKYHVNGVITPIINTKIPVQ
jgi:hypothetical protein